MKTIPKTAELTIWLLVQVFSGFGAVTSDATFALSQASNGIYVGVCPQSTDFRADRPRTDAWRTNTSTARFDEQLLLMFFSSDRKVPILVPCNNSVFIRFTMRSLDGGKVQRTPEGKLWGSQIRQFPNKPGVSRFSKMAPLTALPGPDTQQFQGWPGGLTLPAPKDLFAAEGGSVFDLTLEIHLMREHMSGTNTWTWSHIAIPPLTIRVEKK